MVFIEQPLHVKLLATTVVAGFTTITGFFVWTKHCDVQDLDPVTEPLFRSQFYKQFNPNSNPSQNDVCIRRVPLIHIRPDLLEDASNGGGKLVEAFCGAIFGSYIYTPQRLIHSRGRPAASETSALIKALSEANPTFTSDTSNSTSTLAPTPSKSLTSRLSSLWSTATPQATSPTPTPPPTPIASAQPTELWSPPTILASNYPPHTIITNHFLVLSRTPSTILLRCGSSPLESPFSPRESDGLFALSATPDFFRGYVEFRLKSIFFNGSKQYSPKELEGMRKSKGTGALKPMDAWTEWLHLQYAKMWMETGVAKVRMSKWRSFEAQRALMREQGKISGKFGSGGGDGARGG